MIDDNDLNILKHLGGQGRMSLLKLSNMIGVPNSTLNKRIKQMMDNKLIQFFCEVNPEAFSHIFICFVGISITNKRKEGIDELYNIPNILFATSVTGRYDYMVAFFANSRKMIVNVIDEKISKIKGVTNTETFVVLENRGMFIKSDKFSDIQGGKENAEE